MDMTLESLNMKLIIGIFSLRAHIRLRMRENPTSVDENAISRKRELSGARGESKIDFYEFPAYSYLLEAFVGNGSDIYPRPVRIAE